MTNINGQHGFEVKKCKSHVFNGNNTTNNSNNVTNKTNISDKSTSTVATYPMFNVYKKTPSISSQPSSIVSCRFGSTEDLYCDDELQCIENDPNMRLLDEHLLDRFQEDRFAEAGAGDDESILSMSVPGSGPPSL